MPWLTPVASLNPSGVAPASSPRCQAATQPSAWGNTALLSLVLAAAGLSQYMTKPWVALLPITLVFTHTAACWPAASHHSISWGNSVPSAVAKRRSAPSGFAEAKSKLSLFSWTGTG